MDLSELCSVCSHSHGTTSCEHAGKYNKGPKLHFTCSVKHAESRTRSGRVIKPAVTFPVDPVDEENSVYNVLYRWRFLLVASTFRSWLLYNGQQVRAKAKELTEGGKAPGRRRAVARRRGARGGQTASGCMGLKNLGNTCFMNSVIQALSHTAIFKHYFVSTDIPQLFRTKNGDEELTANEKDTQEQPIGKGLKRARPVWLVERPAEHTSSGRRTCRLTGSGPHKERSLSHEMHTILRQLWTGDQGQGLITPHAMLHAVWRYIPSFRGYMQHDAQEFMCQLLDGVQSELSRLPPPTKAPPPGAESEQRLPSQGKYNNIVSATFGGLLQSKVLCGQCRSLSTTVELFLDLSLDFPKGRAEDSNQTYELDDLLRQFTKTEDLGDNVYMCETCNRHKTTPPCLTPASKTLSLLSLPYILRLHLKRFQWDKGSRAKLSNLVTFPLKGLDMANYCTKAPVVEQASSHVYDLYAIIHHHGPGFDCGHYTASCLSPETGEWADFNDAQVVGNVSPADLVTSSAYILLYSRRDLPIIHDQARQALDADRQNPGNEKRQRTE